MEGFSGSILECMVGHQGNESMHGGCRKIVPIHHGRELMEQILDLSFDVNSQFLLGETLAALDKDELTELQNIFDTERAVLANQSKNMMQVPLINELKIELIPLIIKGASLAPVLRFLGAFQNGIVHSSDSQKILDKNLPKFNRIKEKISHLQQRLKNNLY